MPNKLNVPFGKYLPPEYGTELISQAEEFAGRREEEETRQFLEQINAVGRLHTGSALRGAITGLLGPRQERTESLTRGIALAGAGAGREERMGEETYNRQKETATVGFERSRQTAQENFMRQLDAMAKQYEYQKGLLDYQDELEGGDFFGNLLGSVAGGVGGGFGIGLGKKAYEAIF